MGPAPVVSVDHLGHLNSIYNSNKAPLSIPAGVASKEAVWRVRISPLPRDNEADHLLSYGQQWTHGEQQGIPTPLSQGNRY